MVSELDSGSSGPGLSPGRGHCVVLLGKTLNSLRNRDKLRPDEPLRLVCRLYLPYLTTPSPMIQWKLDFRSGKQKRKNQPVTRPGIKHCDWFICIRLRQSSFHYIASKGGITERNWCPAYDSVGLIFTRSYPCIRLAWLKFELTNQDWACEKNFIVLTSMNVTGKALKKGIFPSGNGIKPGLKTHHFFVANS